MWPTARAVYTVYILSAIQAIHSWDSLPTHTRDMHELPLIFWMTLCNNLSLDTRSCRYHWQWGTAVGIPLFRPTQCCRRSFILFFWPYGVAQWCSREIPLQCPMFGFNSSRHFLYLLFYIWIWGPLTIGPNGKGAGTLPGTASCLSWNWCFTNGDLIVAPSVVDLTTPISHTTTFFPVSASLLFPLIMYIPRCSTHFSWLPEVYDQTLPCTVAEIHLMTLLLTECSPFTSHWRISLCVTFICPSAFLLSANVDLFRII